jgi:hypothetical protein
LARRLPILEAEIAPLEINGTEAARAWVRATEILLRAKARQDARLRELKDGEGMLDGESTSGTEFAIGNIENQQPPR